VVLEAVEVAPAGKILNMQRLWFESYLAMIKNSVGTEMFKNFYIEEDGNKRDVFSNGEYSCSYFVGSVLCLFTQQDKPHATVVSTIRDLEQHGWEKVGINEIGEGDIIVWEPIEFNDEPGVLHPHIGFYIGNNQAISNDYKKGSPQIHALVSSDRKIEAIYSGKAQFAKLPQPS
jgi:hypothetical protein